MGRTDTSLLTEQEIYEMYIEPSSDAEMVAFAREVESALLSKLAAGVSAEPVGHLDGTDDLAGFMSVGLRAQHNLTGSHTPKAFTIPVYTADAIAQARVQENERIAKHFDGKGTESYGIGNEIRALIGKETP